MWRPENWDSALIVKRLADFKKTNDQNVFYFSEAVEAGADAMLEVLKEKGSYGKAIDWCGATEDATWSAKDGKKLWDIVPTVTWATLDKENYGWLIFIPEE